MKKFFLLSSAIGCLLAAPAAAIPMNFGYTTTIDASAIGLSSTASFTAHWTIDSSTPDFNPSSGVGDYSVLAANFQIGSSPVFSWTGATNSSYVHIENNTPTDLFGLELGGTYSGSSINGWSYANDGGLTLYSYSNANWSSEALQTYVPNLDSMAASRLRLAFTNGASTVQLRLPGASSALGYFRSDAEVPFSVVPEPSVQAFLAEL